MAKYFIFVEILVNSLLIFLETLKIKYGKATSGGS